ncbi:MFS transporter [Pseudomonas faucium]|uniref:MFS transporter n=1 Tax=Pseudomonas faucium TaxID=2740518 RepID=UPI0015969A0F|nr:MFS transporter [Pseudomonas faucium]
MKARTGLVTRTLFIYIAIASTMIVGVGPVFLGMLARKFDLPLEQQGWVLSMEMAGVIVGTLFSPAAERRVGTRLLTLGGALLGLAANLSCVQAEGFAGLLACRLVAGVGGGLLYSSALTALGRLPQQARSYGAMLFLQTLLFAAFASVLPVIAERYGLSMAITALAAWFAVIVLICHWLPDVRAVCPVVTEQVIQHAPGSGKVGLYALVGMLCLQMGIYSVWGFLENLAVEGGVAPVDVGWALGLGLLGGLPGSALPSLFGQRLSSNLMIALGSLAVLCSLAMLARGVHQAGELAVAVFVMNVGWTLALTYYMATVATHDPSKRLAPAIGFVQVSAAAVAPALVAGLLPYSGEQVIYLLAAFAIVGGGLMQCLLLRAQRGLVQV